MADIVDHVFDNYFDEMLADVNDGHYDEIEEIVVRGHIDLHYGLDNEVQVYYNLLVMKDILIRID